GTGDELVAELVCFPRPSESGTKAVALGNNTEDCEEGVAEDFFGFAAEELLSGKIHARDSTRQILREDHVAGLLDEVAITRFELRPFKQSRHFGDETRRVKRNF